MNEEVLKELKEIKGLLQEFKEAEATRYLFPAYEPDTKEAAAPSIEEQIAFVKSMLDGSIQKCGENDFTKKACALLEKIQKLNSQESASLDEIKTALDDVMGIWRVVAEEVQKAASIHVPDQADFYYEPSKEEIEKLEKELWLESIGAKEFPEPVQYTYMFPGYRDAFHLSKRYVEETPLDELKETYKQNERQALSAVQAEYDRAISDCVQKDEEVCDE